MKRLILALSMLLCLAAAGKALAAEVAVDVDRTAIFADETVVLTLTLSGGDGEPDLSPIKDFTILSRSTSSNYSLTGGSLQHLARYRYQLSPVKTGRLTIPALSVKVGDELFQTSPLTVVVSEQGNRPDQARDLFLTASLESTSGSDHAYVGENLVYRIKVYSAVRMANASLAEPDFLGAAAKQVEGQKEYAATLKGRGYRVIEVAFVVTPSEPGELHLLPSTLTCEVMRRDSRGRIDSFFSSGLMQSVRVQSNSVNMKILPLPGPPQGVAFSGLVGDFKLLAEPLSQKLAAGESASLAVTVRGTGNIMDAGAPRLDIPEGVKSYADAPAEDISLTDKGYSGEKVYRYALVPTKAGRFNLGRISLTFFDTATGDYRTVGTEPLVLDVTPAAKGEQPLAVVPQNRPATPAKQAVELTDEDILPIKSSLEAVRDRAPMGGWTFGLLLAAPLALLLVALGVSRFASRTPSRRETLRKDARESLARAEEAMGAGETAQAAALMAKAVSSAVCARSGADSRSLTYQEARKLVADAGLDVDLAERASACLRQADAARYGGPAAAVDAPRLLAEAREIVGRLVA